MKHTARSLVRGAVFAALYAVLTFLQNLLLPGTTSAAIQFRLSEALCIFALFTPDAIWGLTLGCFLFNLLVPGSLPLDWLVGTVATALATLAMYRLRHVRVLRVPLPALVMPAAFSTRLTRTDSSNGLTKKNENPLSRSSCSISSLWNAPVTKNVVWVLLVFWAS